MHPGGEQMPGSARGEVVNGLRNHQFACPIQVQARIAVDMAHLGKPDDEWWVGNNPVKGAPRNGLEPRALYKLYLCTSPRGSDGGAGQIKRAPVDICRGNAARALELTQQLHSRTGAQIEHR